MDAVQIDDVGMGERILGIDNGHNLVAVGRVYDSVVVASDTRTSGDAMKHVFISGLLAAGSRCSDAGTVPTPTLALATRGFTAGAMITASHNPPQYNGIKLVNPDGSAFDVGQRAQIEDMVGVMADERFKFFYTDHPFSYTANGFLVTDKRLISYEKTHEDVIVMDCAYEDIEEIEIEEGTSFIADTQLLVFPRGRAEGFTLLFSADESGDRIVINYIESKLE